MVRKWVRLVGCKQQYMQSTSEAGSRQQLNRLDRLFPWNHAPVMHKKINRMCAASALENAGTKESLPYFTPSVVSPSTVAHLSASVPLRKIPISSFGTHGSGGCDTDPTDPTDSSYFCTRL
jgi:hypothetical protein